MISLCKSHFLSKLKLRSENLVLSTELATAKDSEADVPSVSLSSEQIGELWVVCGNVKNSRIY